MSDEAVESFATAAVEAGLTVAVAESLTCGQLAARLGAAHDASDWLRGGVVCYADDVKFGVLGVREGPVVTLECAAQMAAGVARLMRADIALAVTGVGGPDDAEGKPAGTVFIAARRSDTDGDAELLREFHFAGGPEDVLRSTVDAAVALGLELMGPDPS